MGPLTISNCFIKAKNLSGDFVEETEPAINSNYYDYIQDDNASCYGDINDNDICEEIEQIDDNRK